jgi:hypothetical protein
MGLLRFQCVTLLKLRAGLVLGTSIATFQVVYLVLIAIRLAFPPFDDKWWGGATISVVRAVHPASESHYLFSDFVRVFGFFVVVVVEGCVCERERSLFVLICGPPERQLLQLLLDGRDWLVGWGIDALVELVIFLWVNACGALMREFETCRQLHDLGSPILAGGCPFIVIVIF